MENRIPGQKSAILVFKGRLNEVTVTGQLIFGEAKVGVSDWISAGLGCSDWCVLF